MIDKMFRKFGFVLGALCWSGSLFSADDFRYTDIAELLRDDALAIGDAVLHHPIEERKESSSKRHRFPFQVYGDAQYVFHKSKSYHSHTGIGLVGCDLSYQNPILHKTCALGLFAGGTKDRSCPNIVDNKSGFLGYSVCFHFCGLDIATVSSVGFGTSHVAANYTVPGTTTHFDQFTRHHRVLHNQYTASYLWDFNSFLIGPIAGIIHDNIKQNGATEWTQNALHHKLTNGFLGVGGEIDRDKFHMQLFTGIDHRFSFRTDGGMVSAYSITPTPEVPVPNRFVALGSIHYIFSPKWAINAHFSGNFNRERKTCSLGVILNYVF